MLPPVPCSCRNPALCWGQCSPPGPSVPAAGRSPQGDKHPPRCCSCSRGCPALPPSLTTLLPWCMSQLRSLCAEPCSDGSLPLRRPRCCWGVSGGSEGAEQPQGTAAGRGQRAQQGVNGELGVPRKETQRPLPGSPRAVCCRSADAWLWLASARLRPCCGSLLFHNPLTPPAWPPPALCSPPEGPGGGQ